MLSCPGGCWAWVKWSRDSEERGWVSERSPDHWLVLNICRAFEGQMMILKGSACWFWSLKMRVIPFQISFSVLNNTKARPAARALLSGFTYSITKCSSFPNRCSQSKRCYRWFSQKLLRLKAVFKTLMTLNFVNGKYLNNHYMLEARALFAPSCTNPKTVLRHFTCRCMQCFYRSNVEEFILAGSTNGKSHW